MKNGGRIIYHGPLGEHSRNVIDYFMVKVSMISIYIYTKTVFSLFTNYNSNFQLQRIPGVLEMKENTNPATWLLDITSKSSEDKLDVDLAQIYKDSSLFK